MIEHLMNRWIWSIVNLNCFWCASMKIPFYILNAFSRSHNGGNPAGVVLDAEQLSDIQMQVIAKKINLTETAFVQKSNKADFKVRFFTPDIEVDLCGHATIATFSCLKHLQRIHQGKYRQETKTGILDIEIQKNDLIFMNQNIPDFKEKFEKELVANALNIKPEEILSEIPIQIVSTGFPTLLVPLISRRRLVSLSPSLERCVKLCNKKTLLHPFTFETFCPKSIAFSRDFFPIKILDEEAATGTANGALACYLFQYGIIEKLQSQNLVFEQGYGMKRPSEIRVSLQIKENKITEVKVGGFTDNMKCKKIDIRS